MKKERSRAPRSCPAVIPTAWPHVKPIFQAIAAKVADGTPCCDWVGPEGAGHFVKMVHNGIEYGDMQLICEAYHLMSALLGLDARRLHDVFDHWNKGPLDSYLIEITRDILGYVDPETKRPMVDLILDTAGQKGTGKWTVISACDLGVPLTLIAEAVFARCLSAQKDERVAASKVLKGPAAPTELDKKTYIDAVEHALYASKIISYAQGFALMDAMGRESKWEINKGGVALMWRGGCIIRSAFLGKIKEAFDRDPKLPNLLLDPYFRGEIDRCQAGWRRAAAAAIEYGDPRARDDFGSGLFRRLSQRATPRQPPPSPARLFRSAHLRAGRPASWSVLPHQLDRPRRLNLVVDLQRLRHARFLLDRSASLAHLVRFRNSASTASACSRKYSRQPTQQTWYFLRS